MRRFFKCFDKNYHPVEEIFDKSTLSAKEFKDILSLSGFRLPNNVDITHALAHRVEVFEYMEDDPDSKTLLYSNYIINAIELITDVNVSFVHIITSDWETPPDFKSHTQLYRIIKYYGSIVLPIEKFELISKNNPEVKNNLYQLKLIDELVSCVYNNHAEVEYVVILD